MLRPLILNSLRSFLLTDVSVITNKELYWFCFPRIYFRWAKRCRSKNRLGGFRQCGTQSGHTVKCIKCNDIFGNSPTIALCCCVFWGWETKCMQKKILNALAWAPKGWGKLPRNPATRRVELIRRSPTFIRGKSGR